MSINWVMLSPTSKPPFTPLPNEQSIFTSAPRIALSLKTSAHYPGKQQQPFSLDSSSGFIYLTNRRVIYLPDKSTTQLQSFAAPILNLHDSHAAAPWFGPNTWTALLQPTQGGGIPTPPTGVVELKFTFKDGGAFDFSTHYERIRERLQQAVENSRINGDGGGSSRAAMNGVDVSNVDLEDLPVYQERGDGPLIPPIAPVQPIQQSPQPVRDPGNGQAPQRPTDGTPAEPPPGYEEAQMAGLHDEAERRLSEGRQ